MYRKEEKESREEFHKILSNIHSINSSEKSKINISTVTTADGEEGGVTREPQGNKVRRKFRKVGLKRWKEI